MPQLSHDEATLDEILFVRGGPLNEDEIWAILLETCKTLKRIFTKTSYGKLNELVLTFVPDTLLLSLDGTIKFAIPKNGVDLSQLFLPKDYENSKYQSPSARSKAKLELVFVYSLGMMLFRALENGLQNSMQIAISVSLEDVLSDMVKETPHSRVSLTELLKTVECHVEPTESRIIICSLTEEVIGPYGLMPLDDPQVIKALYEESDRRHNKLDEGSHSGNPSPKLHVEPLTSLSPLSNESGRVLSLQEFDDMAYEYRIENSKQISPPIRKSLCPRPLPFPNQQPTRNSHLQNDLSTKSINHQSDNNKAWSPSSSNHDFHGLIGLENKKLVDSGYSRDIPKMVQSKKSYKSMPSLVNIEEDVTMMEQQTVSETPFRKAESMQDMNAHPFGKMKALSMTTSSQVSLTHGAYRLDSPDEADGKLKRYLSFSSQISNQSDQSDVVAYPYYNRTSNMKDPGPEFMKTQHNPGTDYIDVSPPYFGGAPKGLRTIFVILPNSQKVKTTIEFSAKVRELFFQIALHLGVKETVYFGLALFQEKEYIFLDIDVKLSKFAPVGWKDENSKKKKEDYILHFKVKFFIDEPSFLKQTTTIHIYYLQLRQDLLNSLIYCADDQAVELSGYALVAEYGAYCYDYDGVDYFNMYHYLPERIMKSVSPREAMQQMIALHQQHSNLSPEEAELEFIYIAKTLSEYGLFFYQVSRSKKLQDDKIWLGVCVRGIVILDPKENLKAVVHKQAWHLLKEFDFEKKKFIIRSVDHPKMVFYTPHYQRSKYLFNICRSFHRFQLYSPNLQTVQQPKHQNPNPKPKHQPKTSTKSNVQKGSLQKKSKSTLKLESENEDKIVRFSVLKAPTDGLGITIVGGENSNRLLQGIYVKTIHEDGLLANEPRLSVGDQILSVNGKSLEKVSHEEAVEILKLKASKVDLVIQKHKMTDFFNKAGLSPNINHSQLEREDEKEWQVNIPIDKKTVMQELEGIEKLETDENEDEFSERCIDDYTLQPPKEFETPSLHNENTPLPAHKLINNVLIDKDSDSYVSSNDGSITPRSEKNQSNLKRFDGLGELNKMFSDEEDSEKRVSPDIIQKQSSFKEIKEIDSNNGKFHELSSATLDEESSGDLFAVDLSKVDGSFGISIMGGIDSVLPHGGIYVQALQKNGPAYNTGVLQVGDHILSVNDASLENCTHAEAVDILKHATLKSRLVLLRNDVLYRSSSRQSGNNNSNVQDVFEVRLQKGKSGLGMSLAGGADADLVYQGQFMIQKIFPSQAIDKSKEFQIGDTILAINDQILEGLTRDEALAIIRSLPDDIHIIAKRSQQQDIPDELFVSSRPVSPEKILKDLKTKEISGTGRGSREGNRIAKELIKTLSIDDVSTTISDASYPITDEIKNLSFSQHHASPPFANSSEEYSMPPSTSSDHLEQSKIDEDSIKKNSLLALTRSRSCDSDTIVGHPRHRPPLLNSNAQEEASSNRKLIKTDMFLIEKVSTRNIGCDFEKVNGKFVLADIQPNSMIAKLFKNGTQIRSINDIPIDGIDITDIDKLIEEAPDPVKLQIVNPSDLDLPSLPTNNMTSLVKTNSDMKPPRCASPTKNSKVPPLKLPSDSSAQSEPVSPRKQGNSSPLTSVPNSPILKRLNAMSRSNSRESEISRPSKRVTSPPMGELIFVQLEKTTRGLGMTLSTSEIDDIEKYVYIKDIAIGSAAHADGNLCVGDRIVSVNGCNVEGKSQKEIVTMFRVATGFIMIECYRPPPPSPHQNNSPLRLPSIPSDIQVIEPEEKQSHYMDDATPNETFSHADMFDTSSPAPKNNGNIQNFLLPVKNEEFDTSENISFSDAPSLLNSDDASKQMKNDVEPNTDSDFCRAINDLAISDDEQSILDTDNQDKFDDDDEFGFSESVDFSLKDMDADGIIRSPSRVTQFESTFMESDIMKNSENPNKSNDTSSISEKFIEKTDFMVYTTYNVRTRLEKLKQEMENIGAEFTTLRQLKLSASVDIASRAINRPKNRLRNVLPFDENRVKLTGGEETDYINASHIKINEEGLKTEFVVTQAPLKSTVEDFWRCVWECKVEVIAMLVKCNEAGKEKCHQYWPAAETPLIIRDRLIVELLFEEEQSTLVFRQFQIKNIKLGKCLFVTQVCFKNWPETGLPDNMVQFLNFMKFVRSFKKSSSPTLVHCSGGVGRSGVFVIIHYIWSAIEGDHNFDVFKVAKSVKTQRQQILQTKEQYSFVYEAAKTLLEDLID